MNEMMFKNFKRICLIGGLSGALVSCENVDEISRLNDSIKDREETLVDLDARIAKEEKSLEENTKLKETADRYEEVMGKLKTIEDELETEKAKTAEARAALKTASLKLIDYRNQYRRSIREKAKGTLIDLSATKGPDYKDVRISRITPLEIRVLLKSGPKGVPFYELPADVQGRFQFSEEEATTYRNAVTQYLLARAKNNQVVDADKQVEEATAQASEATASIAEKKSLIASITRKIKSKEVEAERIESLARHWKTEENNSTSSRRSGAANSRAVKLSDQANEIRLGISRAKESIAQLRHEIGQILKKN